MMKLRAFREDKEGRHFCISPPLNLNLYIEEKSRRKGQPRRLVDTSKMPQAASERLIHDPVESRVGEVSLSFRKPNACGAPSA